AAWCRAAQAAPLTILGQAPVAGRAGVDAPPLLSPSRRSGGPGPNLAVDHHYLALTAHHLLGRGRGSRVASAVEGDVGDDQGALTGHRDRLGVLNNDRSVESGRQLVSDMAVVVGVVPESPGRVVVWQDDFVVEGLAGGDADEGVVAIALGGDVQPVYVQVGRGVEFVGNRHSDRVSAPNAQGGAWECAVERLHVCVSPADLDPGGGGDQLQIEHTVPTGHHVRLEKVVTTVGEATTVRGVAL